MKRKSPEIRQGAVTELMTELANLSERKRDPEKPVSLSEIFRAKEYMAEVKAALKKGYSFDDLAEIFSEKCGVAVSARQIKYHFTREKNRGMKSKSRAKAGGISVTGSRASSAHSPGKDPAGDSKGNVAVSDSLAKDSSKGSGFIFENEVTTSPERNAKPGAFSFDAKPEES